MTVLSALSILAVAALLWAAVSIVSAVRRAKRRRQQRASAAIGAIYKAPGTASNTSDMIFYEDHQAPQGSTEATSTTGSHLPPPIPGPPAPRLRNFPTRLGKHPVAAANPGAPAEWNPFDTGNKDFADLTDPTPGGRRLQPRPRRRDRTDRTG